MTGWSGDGAPGDGSLRNFAVGAVRQHFTKTLNRNILGDDSFDPLLPTDAVLPTSAELDALEAFQLSTGRPVDMDLAGLVLKDADASTGQALFVNGTGNPLAGGKCNACHMNAGALSTFDGQNNNFDTGVEVSEATIALREQYGIGALPFDGGFGLVPNSGGFGDGSFNTPPLVEAADTLPLFHNNSAETLEAAIAFFNSDAFNAPPAPRREDTTY